MEYEHQYPEEDSRYLEITEEYDHLSRKADFARGRILRQIRDEQIYGRWGSFTNCANGQITRMIIFRGDAVGRGQAGSPGSDGASPYLHRDFPRHPLRDDLGAI
jgi:hypothetical protein